MSTCKGCGKPILWAVTEDGKKIPLDPTPPVYQVIGTLNTVLGDEKLVARAKEGYYVSHFSTCSHANEFSASKKKKAEGQ